MRTIAIVNSKGGVGKTLTCRSLATCLAQTGHTVLAVDGDPGGDLTRQFGILPTELEGCQTLTKLYEIELDNRCNYLDAFRNYNPVDAIIHTDDDVDLLPAGTGLSTASKGIPHAINGDYIMRDILKRIGYDYDFAIIDTAPNIDRLLINNIAAADSLIIPTFAEEQSIHSIRALIPIIKRIASITNPSLLLDGVLFTNVKINTNINQVFMDITKKTFPVNIYDSYIPSRVCAQYAVANHISIIDQDEDSAVASAYKKFTEEFLVKQLNYVPITELGKK